MKLKTIEEHNAEVRRLYKKEHLLTGIACPHCENELQYIDNTLLLSSPPQKRVTCFECGYKGSVSVLSH
tara:strand:+ start:1299 stop:1505 length:207 start_codon:yes stop_codon:yes gene_type:complete